MQVPRISDIERYPDRYPVSLFLLLFLFDGVTTSGRSNPYKKQFYIVDIDVLSTLSATGNQHFIMQSLFQTSLGSDLTLTILGKMIANNGINMRYNDYAISESI